MKKIALILCAVFSLFDSVEAMNRPDIVGATFRDNDPWIKQLNLSYNKGKNTIPVKVFSPAPIALGSQLDSSAIIQLPKIGKIFYDCRVASGVTIYIRINPGSSKVCPVSFSSEMTEDQIKEAMSYLYNTNNINIMNMFAIVIMR